MTTRSASAPRTRRRLRAATIVVVVIGMSALALGWWGGRNTSSEVSSEDVADLVGATQGSTQIDPGRRPRAGTYSYTGRGWDSFSFGGGSKHTFPTNISVVVEFDRSGCEWMAHVVFIKEHFEKRAFCTDASGVKDAGFSRITSTLGRKQTSSYSCTDGAWRSAVGTRIGRRWAYTCTERRGGVVQYAGQRLEDAKVRVGGQAVSVRHIRIRGTQRGKHVGDEVSEYWLLESGLPARFVSTRSLRVSTPMGDMASRESYAYTLSSMDPKTA